jgi:UDP-glucose 4-epimerase
MALARAMTDGTAARPPEGVILVTGGAGVVGSYVVRELVVRGEHPVVLDVAPARRLAQEIGRRIDVVTADITDQAALLDICRRCEIGVILHLGALTGAAPDDDPMLLFRVNMQGTMHVLEAARATGVRRVVMASTRTVYPNFEGTPYGHPTCRPVPEEHWLDPTRPYEIWKHAAERTGEFYRRKFGLEFAAFRFAIYYAAERTFSPGGRAMGLLHEMIGNAAAGLPTRIASGGERIMDCVYVRDLGRAFALAARSPALAHATYNIGSGRPATPRDVAEAVRRAVPDAVIEIGGGIDFAPGHYCVLDVGRAGRDFGYAPQWSLEAGVADCVARVRELRQEQQRVGGAT